MATVVVYLLSIIIFEDNLIKSEKLYKISEEKDNLKLRVLN